MTRIICVASVVYFKIRFFFEIYYHENSNFPFAAGLMDFPDYYEKSYNYKYREVLLNKKVKGTSE
ncbi:hypothetical protein IYZ83_002270 [Wolbachia pipientis]|uniref:hypothetical protein n=1 Tax=Wolbachia pipientis TaxID=955 RepID=UPI001BDAB6A2|nr:hypothetical protein [Wolbachia pipientis]UIP92035.1 hypothetical protein IYZ83_002270 [Wolbachia pipientis]